VTNPLNPGSIQWDTDVKPAAPAPSAIRWDDDAPADQKTGAGPSWDKPSTSADVTRTWGEAATDTLTGIGQAGLSSISGVVRGINDRAPGAAEAERESGFVAGLLMDVGGKVYEAGLGAQRALGQLAGNPYVINDANRGLQEINARRAASAPEDLKRAKGAEDFAGFLDERAARVPEVQSEKARLIASEMGQLTQAEGLGDQAFATIDYFASPFLRGDLSTGGARVSKIMESLIPSLAAGGIAAKAVGAAGAGAGIQTAAQLGTMSVMEGGGAAEGARGEVLNTPIESLQSAPEFQAALRMTGGDPIRARALLADQAASISFGLGTAAAGATMGLGQVFGANVAEQAVREGVGSLATGAGVRQALLGVAGATGKEFASEFAQGASNQAAQNVGVTATGASDSLGRGVVAAGIMEGIAGAGSGAAAQGAAEVSKRLRPIFDGEDLLGGSNVQTGDPGAAQPGGLNLPDDPAAAPITTAEVVALRDQQLSALQAKANGRPDQTVVDPVTGKPVTVRGEPPQPLSEAERQMLEFLQKYADSPDKLARSLGRRLDDSAAPQAGPAAAPAPAAAPSAAAQQPPAAPAPQPSQAAPQPAAEPEQQPAQGVPTMVTQRMKAQLRERGFTDQQIRAMTPQAAWDAINSGAQAAPQAQAAQQQPAPAPSAPVGTVAAALQPQTADDLLLDRAAAELQGMDETPPIAGPVAIEPQTEEVRNEEVQQVPNVQPAPAEVAGQGLQGQEEVAPAPASAPQTGVVAAALAAQSEPADPDAVEGQLPAESTFAAGRAEDVPTERAPESFIPQVLSEIGWLEKGGRMIRDPSTAIGASSQAEIDPERGDVVGRTKWIGKPSADGRESLFWRMRPDQSLSESEATAAVQKWREGRKLGKRQQAFIDYMQKAARDYAEQWNTERTETLRAIVELEAEGIVEERDELRAAVRPNLSPEDEREALQLDDLLRRAADAGATRDQLLDILTSQPEPQQARTLWHFIKTQERDRGTDQAGPSEAAGLQPEASGRGQAESDRAGEAAPRGAEAEPAAAPAADPRAEGLTLSAPAAPAVSRQAAPPSQQGGLFAPPTRGEVLAGERKRRDDERDGKNATGRTDMMAGDGELFAGPRPEQADVEQAIAAEQVAERPKPWTVSSSEWMTSERAEIDAARASEDAEIPRLRARVEYNRNQLRGRMPKTDRARLEQLVDDDEFRILQLSSRPLDPDGFDITPARHRRIVESAMRRGESIPAEVFAEYPDLAAEAQSAPPSQGEKVEAAPDSPVVPPGVLDAPANQLVSRLNKLVEKREKWNLAHMQKYRDGSATRAQTTTHSARIADLNEQIKELRDAIAAEKSVSPSQGEKVKAARQPLENATAPDAEQESDPVITETQARQEIEWIDMGTQGGVKSLRLRFRGMAYGDLEKSGKGRWIIEGSGESFVGLAEAKRAVADTAIERLIADGYVERAPAVEAARQPSANTIFTEDAAEKARARLRAKLGRPNSGIDPEMLQDGITLAGYHIERGARTFAAYARAMVEDMGDAVRPFLKSWYLGVKFDPRAASIASEMDSAAAVESADANQEFGDVPSSPGDVAGAGQSGPAAASDVAEADAAAGGEAAAGAGQPSGRVGAGAPGARGTRGPAGGAAAGRAGRDQRVPAQQPDGREPAASDAGAADGRGSRGDGGSGVQAERDGARGATEAAARARGDRDKLTQQRAAESIPVRLGDIENIRATLPYLLEGQQDDVAKAEARFAKPDGYGMLFTNGTGTGKTFTGLGIVKRFQRQGKTNVLIVAPSDKIMSDWVKSGIPLGLDITQLASTSDAGRGIVVTTYANLGQNDALAKREWDLIVADEAHYLMRSADGERTAALDALRAITLHPDGYMQRTNMLHRELVDRGRDLSDQAKRARMSDDQRDWFRAKGLEEQASAAFRELDARRKEVQADVMAKQGASRTRAVFLSATPFAYEKTVDWAQGYLFTYPESQGGGYNSPDSFGAFMMSNFGYRMRYGKLTAPEAGVDSGLMQRMFNTRLKREGVLSGRRLDVAADYSRNFVLVESAIGRRIDQALEWLRENDGTREISDKLRESFDYLARRYTLEALKARESVALIREHLALGRKVVVFHDYKKGGARNPFDFDAGSVGPTEAQTIEQFRAEFGDLIEGMRGLISPIDLLQREFPDLLLFNGDVSPKNRRANVDTFNDDSTGPRVILVQTDAGKEGISLHDTTGEHQRALINLGMPTKPTDLIQQEGRIYRTGQVSNAIFSYLNTGTSWERATFAQTIAGRASAAENLGMGEEARALKDSLVQAFEDSAQLRPGYEGEGTGGKAADAAAARMLTEHDRAVSLYYANQKKTQRTKSAEGTDYFATPEPVGLAMVRMADIRPGESALEPSAGHGAIARWFGDTVKKTAVEPSPELASRLALSFDGRIVDGRFESLDLVNKFDAIVMNPPFGTAGRTAVDHVAKAAKHLREGGRIVALIPTGPAADKKFDAWLYEQDDKGRVVHPDLHLVATIELPAVTFERAGTNVRTRIVVVDKLPADVMQLAQQDRDLSSAETIKELFDRVENLEIRARTRPAEPEAETAPAPAPQTERKAKAESRDAARDTAKAAGVAPTGEPIVTHITGKGKELVGVVRTGITKAQAQAIDAYTFAKNGGWFIRVEHLKPAGNFSRPRSAALPAAVVDQTQTPEFRRWFGNSKVVDAEGRPLVVYHGTTFDFEAFKTGKAKKGNELPFGAHFTPSPDIASQFADSESGNVLPVYLSILAPLDLTPEANEFAVVGTPEGMLAEEAIRANKQEPKPYRRWQYQPWTQGTPKGDDLVLPLKAELDVLRGDRGRAIIQKAGYDGAVYSATYYRGPFGSGGRTLDRSYIAFRPEQIKSSTGNRGTFDPADPRIAYSQPMPGDRIPMGPLRSDAAMRFAVAAALDGWAGQKPIVRVVRTAAELPADAKMGEGWQTAEGYFDGADGVWLVTENLADPQRALEVLRHEAVGHFGVERIAGASWPSILAGVESFRGQRRNSMSKPMAAALAEAEARYEAAASDDPLLFAKELLAVMAETGTRATWMDRMLSQLRAFLRKTGLIGDAFSEAELRNVLSGAFRLVERGGSLTAGAPVAAGGMQSIRPDDVAAYILRMMGQSDADLFRYPKSDSTSFAKVVKDVSKNAIAAVKLGEVEANFTENLDDMLPAVKWGLRLPDGSQAFVYIEQPSPYTPDSGLRMFIDASAGNAGASLGSAAYAALFQWALNTGHTFIGDPNGLSTEALLRRTEHMLSAALKHGTTRMMAPHARQVDPMDKKWGPSQDWAHPLEWTDGDDVANVTALIRTSVENHRALLQGTEADGAVYRLSDGQFIGAGGQPLTDEGLRRAAATAGARFRASGRFAGPESRAAAVGGSTVARTLVLGSLLDGSTGSTGQRRELLADLAERLSAQRLTYDRARGLFYSRPGASRLQQNMSTDRSEAISQILDAIKRDGRVEGWGLRVIDVDPDVGSDGFLPPSFVWDNGDQTEETLNGTSAVGIRELSESGIDKALRLLGVGGSGENGFYFGDRVLLVNGEPKGSGEDAGEVILAEAELIGQWKKSGSGPNEILPNPPGLFSQPRLGPQLPQNLGQGPAASAARGALLAVRQRVQQLTSRETIDRLLYEFQDKFVDLKRIQAHIRESGGTVSDLNDAYLGEELYHSRVMARHERFMDSELKPLLADLNAGGFTIEQFEQFLHARHAPEANAALMKRNPDAKTVQDERDRTEQAVRTLRVQLQQAQSAGTATRAIEQALELAELERDRWKRTQPFKGTNTERAMLSGMSDADAAAIMAALSPADRAKMDALAARVDAINAKTLDQLERYGLMSRADLDAWRQTYQHYVPLHRDEANPDSVSHPTGSGFSVRGDAAKSRTGSAKAKVTNILAHIAMQREAAITRGEKNAVAKRLYVLAGQNPDPDLWTLDKAPTITRLDPATGTVRSMPDPTYRQQPNVVMVRIAGEDRAIVFSERNPRALRLAESLKGLDVDDLHVVLGWFSKATRWFASVNTQYNPVFGIINLLRDVQGSALQLSTTPLKGRELQVVRRIPAMLRSIYRERRGKGTASPDDARLQRLWDDMRMTGGVTGYRDLFRDPMERANAIEAELRKSERGMASRAAHAVVDWLSDYNEAIENATRLAVYEQGLAIGMTKERAASVAKNITVNFNRKGRQARELGALFAFFNAAVQGTTRMVETLAGPRGRAIMAGGVALGFVNSLIGLAVMGGDEWEKIPDHVKERAVIIPISGSDYISIPMPLGYHVFPNIGRIAAEWMTGGADKSIAGGAAELLRIGVDAFNPLGGTSTPLQMIMPTALDPIAALAENKDWTGRPIYREDFSNTDPTPGFTRAKDSASLPAKVMAWGANALSGGDDYQPGAFSPTPDQIDYIMGQLTGGLGREILKAQTTLAAPFSDDELPAYKIPLVSRLYGNTRGEAGESQRFYESLRELNIIERRIKGMAQAGEDVDAYMAAEPLAGLVGMGTRSQSVVQRLRSAQRRASEAGDRDQAEAIRLQIAEVMADLNREVRAAKQ
jgi:hypothetical protein